MPTYTVTVRRTQMHDADYTIEAATEDEAWDAVAGMITDWSRTLEAFLIDEALSEWDLVDDEYEIIEVR